MSQAFRVIRDYGDLVDAFVDQRKALAMSTLALDARAGFHEGYASKLENWDKPYGRGLGPVTLRLWLEALGLALIVVRVDDGRKARSQVDDRQLQLELVGGRMNPGLIRKGFKRFRSPTLPDIVS